jgi:hypothetical protein
MGVSPPTFFPRSPELERWWHALLTTHRAHPDVAIAEALERGLRGWILPCLPRDVDADLDELALRLVWPLTQAVRKKVAQRFKREAQRRPDAPVQANATATLDAILQALLRTYVQLLRDRAHHPRDALAMRVARLCAAPIDLPSKKGQRSPSTGEDYEWWLVVLQDQFRQVMRQAFPAKQWATTGRTPEKHARLEKLRATWPTLPDAVLKDVSQEDVRVEAERRLTAAVAEMLAGVPAAPGAVRRARLRHRDLIRRLDAADHAGSPGNPE